MKTTLSCKKIAPLLYLTPEEHSPEEAKRVRDHLETCSACREIHEKMLSVRSLTIDNLAIESESPVILPHLTVVRSGSKNNSLSGSVKSTSDRWAFVLRQVRIVSSIASVLLVCLFLSEQALSVQKIARLEKRLEQTVPTATSGLIDRLTQLHGSQALASLTVTHAELPVSAIPLNPQSLSRIKYLINKGLISVKTADPAAAVWVRQLLTLPRSGVSQNLFTK